MSEHNQTADDGTIEAGLFTRLRPFARWFIIAAMIVGLVCAVLALVGITA